MLFLLEPSLFYETNIFQVLIPLLNSLGARALLQWPVDNMIPTDNFALPSASYMGDCTSFPVGFCPPPGQPLREPLPLGVYNFTYQARDYFGNAALPVIFIIIIKDVCPPQILFDEHDGSGPQPKDNNQLFLSEVVALPGQPHALITCPSIEMRENSAAPVHWTYSSQNPSGLDCNSRIPISQKLLRVESTLLKMEAKDAAGNVVVGTILITVKDAEPPVLMGCGTEHIPVIILAVCDMGKNTATVFMPKVSATDNSGLVNVTTTNCTTNVVNKVVSCQPYLHSPSVSFPCGPGLQGTTEISYRTTDLTTVVVGKIQVIARDTQVLELFSGTLAFTASKSPQPHSVTLSNLTSFLLPPLPSHRTVHVKLTLTFLVFQPSTPTLQSVLHPLPSFTTTNPLTSTRSPTLFLQVL